MKLQKKMIPLFMALLLLLLLPGLALGDGQVSIPATQGSEELEALQDQLLGQMLRSERPGLEPPYSDMYKTYADYFGGAELLGGSLVIYTTDTEAAGLQAYAGREEVKIQRVDYSLNELNALALQIVELGEAGKIQGYAGPPAVISRHNYVALILGADKSQAGAGLSPATLREALEAPASMLRIQEAEEYPQREDGAYVLPKTGGRGALVGFGILAVAGILICIGLYRLYRP